jgi:plasmid stability protein
MASLTIRNIPDDAKLRFRQIAAAHGRSMEEHLRQLVIEADFVDALPQPGHVAEARQSSTPEPRQENIVQKLLRLADGTSDHFLDPRKYEEIRFMNAKDALAELRRLANGVGFDVPRNLNTEFEAPEF